MNMAKENYTLTTHGEGGMHYAKMLPAPFELDTATLSDLVAVMQWCKWEIKDWKRILKDELKTDHYEAIQEAHDEIEKTEHFLEAVEDEIAKRLLPTLNMFA